MGYLVPVAKSEDKKPKTTPEWQKNVAIATNAAGAVAGPAALVMAVNQARAKEGGMPRKSTEFVERKTKPTSRTGKIARKTGKVLRNPKAIAAGGVTAVGLQAANWAGDSIAARALTQQKKLDKENAVSKSIEQSIVSKSAAVPVTGHGVNIEKRDFNAEADRQRRLGMYAGLGAVGAAGFGAAASRGMKVEGRKRGGQVFAVKEKGRKKSGSMTPRKKLAGRAGLAALAGASAAGGIAAYRRGISERNYPYN